MHDNPGPYVRKIMVNTYTSWWNRRRRGEVPTADLPDDTGTRDDTGDIDDRATLWPALARLTRRQRAVIVLRFYEDQPEAVVADLLGDDDSDAFSGATVPRPGVWEFDVRPGEFGLWNDETTQGMLLAQKSLR